MSGRERYQDGNGCLGRSTPSILVAAPSEGRAKKHRALASLRLMRIQIGPNVLAPFSAIGWYYKDEDVSLSQRSSLRIQPVGTQPVWPSRRALSWRTDGAPVESALAHLCLQMSWFVPVL